MKIYISTYKKKINDMNVGWVSADGIRVIELAAQLCLMRDRYVQDTFKKTNAFEHVYRTNMADFDIENRGMSDGRKRQFCINIISTLTSIDETSEYRFPLLICKDPTMVELRKSAVTKSPKLVQTIGIFLYPIQLHVGVSNISNMTIKKIDPFGCCLFDNCKK
jgi:hypothetical protein